LQKAGSAADAVVELSLAVQPHAALWQKTKLLFANVLKDVESIRIDELTVTLRGGLTAANWTAKGDHLFEILASCEKPVVLLLDEVPILVNRLLKGADCTITPERREAADAFLSWLRANSVRHQGKIRMVASGSIGLEPLVRQAGLSATLNTFSPFSLGPWSPEVAGGCLLALARGYSITLPADVIEDMLERLGWLAPAHVQMYFDYVYQECRLRGTAQASRELVADVYDHSMLGIRGHVELSHMEERLRTVLGPELYVLALELLTEAAVVGAVTGENAKYLAQELFAQRWQAALRDALDVLEHDGYLATRRGEYSFISRLLRDWWKRRFELAYVPVSQREVRRGDIAD
jgi:hypothetical protein